MSGFRDRELRGAVEQWRITRHLLDVARDAEEEARLDVERALRRQGLSAARIVAWIQAERRSVEAQPPD